MHVWKGYGRHNAFGNRVAKLVDGVVVEKYLWENKTRLLATFDGNNNLKHSYEYTVGNTPTSYYVGNQRYYILTDQLGSPRIITDSAGNVLREIEYDSIGTIMSMMLPYRVAFLIGWTVLLVLWTGMDWPLGVINPPAAN